MNFVYRQKYLELKNLIVRGGSLEACDENNFTFDNSDGAKNKIDKIRQRFSIGRTTTHEPTNQIPVKIKNVTYNADFSCEPQDKNSKMLKDNFVHYIEMDSLTFGPECKFPMCALGVLTEVEQNTRNCSKLVNLKKLNFGPVLTNMEISSKAIMTQFKNLEELTFGDNFTKIDGAPLDNLKSLKKLTFGNSSISLSPNALSKLLMLEELTFGDNFIGPLVSNNISDLKNLKKITFGKNFNQPNLESIKVLSNLEYLTLPESYKGGKEVEELQRQRKFLQEADKSRVYSNLTITYI
jgi:Leucine-rich repeat (LRR) protein